MNPICAPVKHLLRRLEELGWQLITAAIVSFALGAIIATEGPKLIERSVERSFESFTQTFTETIVERGIVPTRARGTFGGEPFEIELFYD